MVKINKLPSKHNLFKQRLSQLADPPKSLYYIGKLLGDSRPVVGIVGSRKPTAYAQEMTTRLAVGLAQHGVVIVSGLALGIDGLAHRGALGVHGTTIAVLGGGLDTIYPSRHRTLALEILRKGGVLLSEYPPGAPYLPHQFIARNRIIAALCDGLIITEAATKSGSLHTAGFALDLGKVVMAVPGEATNPMASGCLNLLKSGACLVTDTADALFALGLAPTTQSRLPLKTNSTEETQLLALLQEGVQLGEALLQKSGLTIAQFNQALTMLELQGLVRPLGVDRWTLAQP